MQNDHIINRRKIGSEYERRAVTFLEENGVVILDVNFSLNRSFKGGEIDIIGIDEGVCIFVEVKYRKNTSHGYPAQSVTFSKQKTICRIATLYVKIKNLPINGRFRFDVISILDNEIEWYKNAFQYHV